MADRSIKVLTPGTNFDLATLAETKMLMGISPTDTSEDTQLQFWISIASQTIARMCNRTFAREQCIDQWREFQYASPYGSQFTYVPATLSSPHRIFLSHWPVATADVLQVESPVGSGNFFGSTQWELEEQPGKLSLWTESWTEPIAVTFWGGYVLPDEAPLPLKEAVAVLCVQYKLLASLGTMAGVRLLSHKDKRVAFHDPLKILEAAMGGKGAATSSAVMNLLAPYMRVEV
jgi:hypothetical protein